MNELLQSIKADLLSRHMLPLLAAAGVALLGALGYAVLGGGGGEAKPPTLTPAAPASSGLPVSLAPPSTTAAAAETPAGIQYQTQGPTRDPFSSSVGAPATSSASAASGTAGSSSSAGSAGQSSGSGSSGGKGGSSSKAGVSPAAPPSASPPSVPGPVPRHTQPTPPAKPEVVPYYSVSALFGSVPASPAEQPMLTPYEDMKRFEPLPTAKAARLVFAGVVAKDGKQRALFALVSPPILRGQASCYPSDTHCQWIELAAGKSEELEYIQSNGQAAAFELKIVRIVKRSAVAARSSDAKALQISKAGRRALFDAGLSLFGAGAQASVR